MVAAEAIKSQLGSESDSIRRRCKISSLFTLAIGVAMQSLYRCLLSSASLVLSISPRIGMNRLQVHSPVSPHRVFSLGVQLIVKYSISTINAKDPLLAGTGIHLGMQDVHLSWINMLCGRSSFSPGQHISPWNSRTQQQREQHQTIHILYLFHSLGHSFYSLKSSSPIDDQLTTTHSYSNSITFLHLQEKDRVIERSR